MHKVLVVIAGCAILLVAGCAPPSIVKPQVPVGDFKSSYRQTKEVLLVSCTAEPRSGWGTNRRLDPPVTSVVETTDSGIRFVIAGCMGTPGDRFRITY